MKKSVNNGVVVLTPDEGFRLTNGELYLDKGDSIYLGSGDSEDNWKEVLEIVCTIFDESSEFVCNLNGGHIETSRYFVDNLMCNVTRFVYNSNDYCGGSVFTNIKDLEARRSYNKVRITYCNSSEPTGIRLQFGEGKFIDTFFESTDSEFITTEINLPEDFSISSFEIYVQGSRGHIEGEFFIKDIIAVA